VIKELEDKPQTAQAIRRAREHLNARKREAG